MESGIKCYVDFNSILCAVNACAYTKTERSWNVLEYTCQQSAGDKSFRKHIVNRCA